MKNTSTMRILTKNATINSPNSFSSVLNNPETHGTSESQSEKVTMAKKTTNKTLMRSVLRRKFLKKRIFSVSIMLLFCGINKNLSEDTLYYAPVRQFEH